MIRAIFFEEYDARAVAVRLQRDGWHADLVLERLAGEDDDEDHHWAVLTDAPEPAVELLVDVHDGWLDIEPPTRTRIVLPAPALPSEPRRRRGGKPGVEPPRPGAESDGSAGQ